MLSYLTVSTTAELICFFIAFLCLNKDSSGVWKSMILFLFITCLTELLGIHFRKLFLEDRVHAHQNVWLYNILLVFQACFISFMFHHLLKKYTQSKPIIISGLVILSVFYIFGIFTHGIFVYNETTNTVMLVVFVVYSLYYYYRLLKDDKYVNFTYSAEFWWVAGLLLFYFGSTASDVFFDNLSPYKAASLKTLSSSIFKALNIILYSCWSYSFICRKWLTTTSAA
jgi:hypothetical protein